MTPSSILAAGASPICQPTHGPPEWDAGARAFVITRYVDVQRLLKSDDVAIADVATSLTRLSVRLGGAFPSLLRLVGTPHPLRDEPEHGPSRAWYRALIAGIAQRWTAKVIADWTERRIAYLGPDGTVDAVPVLADALPEAVVADAFGLPPAEVRRLAKFARHISGVWHREAHALRDLRSMEVSAATLVAAFDARAEAFHATGATALAENDGPDGHARLGFLLTAGIETTSGLLASCLDLLSHRPDLQRRLRAEPELVAPFVEEALRLYPPLRRVVGRVACAPIVFAERTIPAGGSLILDIEQAHHDPAAFPLPEQFDLERRGPPNLGFGAGAHACVGAAVARVELRAAITCVTRDFVLHPAGEARLHPERNWRHFETLPLRFERLGEADG